MNIKKISHQKKEDKKQTFLSKIKSSISNHRLGLRSKILSTPLNLITIASLLPFFIGFYEFLNKNQQLKRILFKKNIPGFDIPTEIINWDTFRYFKKNKKDFFVEIEKVEWSPQALFLTKKLNKTFADPSTFSASSEIMSVPRKQKILLNQIEFSSVIQENDIQIFGTNRFYINYFSKQKNFSLQKNKNFCHILQNFYLNLDEIPLKLDNLLYSKNLLMGKNSANNQIALPFDKQNLLKQTNLKFQQKIWKKNTNNITFFSLSSQSNFSSLNKKSTKTKINPIGLLKPYDSQRKYFGNGSLLIKKQLPCIIENNSSIKGSKTSTFIIKKKQKSSPKIYKVEKVFNNFDFSDVFSIPQKSTIQSKKLNSRKIFLEKQEQIENLLPQINEILKEKNTIVQRRMSGYIYPDMDVMQVRRFLLHNLYSSFSKNFSNKVLNNIASREIYQKNFQIILPANPAFTFKSFSNTKLQKFSFLKSKITEISPTQLLKKKNDIEKYFFYKQKMFFNLQISSSPENTQIENKNGYLMKSNSLVDEYFYLPAIFPTQEKSLSGLYGEFFNDEFTLINYKKSQSLFSKPQLFEKIFFDSWEPFNFHSWLIVSQVGFAILVFNFLKSLFIEYFNELIWFLIDFGFSAGIVDENLKEEIGILTGQRDKGFRITLKPEKKFKDIGGMKSLLPEIAEIVWFLRNRGKEFYLSQNFPRGVLFIGPPGTGKTVLVQAIAGEAEVPILRLSGSSLFSSGESGGVKLEIMFQEARQLAPCIVFIDEIETLAKKREGVMQNPMGGDEILAALDPINASLLLENVFLQNNQTSYFQKNEQIQSLSVTASGSSPSFSSQQDPIKIHEHNQAQENTKKEQLALLIQLLIELDGIRGRQGVIVIGATNQPELLDPAILRPGRFEKIVELGLPSYEKRLEIFKLYGKILGSDTTVSWEYFARRTVGFTPADIASIVNQSSIKAIYNETKKHNVNTIESGIDIITASESEKPYKKVSNLLKYRLAYYQAGKIILSTLLEYHPPTLISYLWPRRQNLRSLQIASNLQKYFFQCARRCELEHRIIGCYGGKAAEILFLPESPITVSNFGLEDLSFAFVLICFTIEKWYLYSKSTLLSQLTQVFPNKNLQEFLTDKSEFFKELSYSMEFSPHLLYSNEIDVPTHALSQNFFSTAWWQFTVAQEFESVERHFSDWYRLYLPNPEEKEKNIEWTPPDEFYHRNLLNKKLTKNSFVSWNELHKIARDYQVHSFVLESFNKALCLIDENREFLDRVVFELVKTEVLREPEIKRMASDFVTYESKINLSSTTPINFSTQDFSKITIVNNSFGEFSRRKIKNWVDFKDFANI